MTVNIYMLSGSRTPRRIHRTNYYILEVETEAEPATAGGFCTCDESMHGASVATLQAATKRLHYPVDVKIYTDDAYIFGAINSLQDMRATDFKKASGEPVAYADQWAEIAKRVKSAAATMESHSYADWMRNEIIKRGK